MASWQLIQSCPEVKQRPCSHLQSDVNDIADAEPFDPVVGRFILMFFPDPLAILRSLARLVRSGGMFAFQEPTWVPMLVMFAAAISIWTRSARVLNSPNLVRQLSPGGLQLVLESGVRSFNCAGKISSRLDEHNGLYIKNYCGALNVT